MKIVIQRCLDAQVSVEGEVVSKIPKGMLLLVCMEKSDLNKGPSDLEKVSQKILNLRIFTDPETGKIDHNIHQIEGEILCVSQFTLSWDGKKGNRPSFDNSMAPDEAVKVYDDFCERLNKEVKVSKGVFGASMKVSLTNDGPVTFSLDF